MFGLTTIPRNFPQVSIGDVNQSASPSNLSSYSLSGTYGAADPRRMVLLMPVWIDSADTLTSATSSSIAHTIHGQRRQGNANCAVTSVLLPDDTMGTDVLTFSGTISSVHMRTARLLKFRKTTAFDVKMNGAVATSVSVTIRVPPLGALYCVAASQSLTHNVSDGYQGFAIRLAMS
jgi:hypothetical protein